MDLFIGIHKARGTIGVRATCGIYRECRRVQHRQQDRQQHRDGERIEKAHGRVSRLCRSPHGTPNHIALMTSEWIAPYHLPSPLGTINPLRFSNSSGKSGCPLWLGKIGESAETFGGPVNALLVALDRSAEGSCPKKRPFQDSNNVSESSFVAFAPWYQVSEREERFWFR